MNQKANLWYQKMLIMNNKLMINKIIYYKIKINQLQIIVITMKMLIIFLNRIFKNSSIFKDHKKVNI